MPYILKERRNIYNSIIDKLVDKWINEGSNMGELNYIITKIINDVTVLDYYSLNAIVGVLECIEKEYYRKVVAKYEDKKCKENGDIFQTEK